jgi:hypothetical protein
MEQKCTQGCQPFCREFSKLFTRYRDSFFLIASYILSWGTKILVYITTLLLTSMLSFSQGSLDHRRHLEQDAALSHTVGGSPLILPGRMRKHPVFWVSGSVGHLFPFHSLPGIQFTLLPGQSRLFHGK